MGTPVWLLPGKGPAQVGSSCPRTTLPRRHPGQTLCWACRLWHRCSTRMVVLMWKSFPGSPVLGLHRQSRSFVSRLGADRAMEPRVPTTGLAPGRKLSRVPVPRCCQSCRRRLGRALARPFCVSSGVAAAGTQGLVVLGCNSTSHWGTPGSVAQKAEAPSALGDAFPGSHW